MDFVDDRWVVKMWNFAGIAGGSGGSLLFAVVQPLEPCKKLIHAAATVCFNAARPASNGVISSLSFWPKKNPDFPVAASTANSVCVVEDKGSNASGAGLRQKCFE